MQAWWGNYAFPVNGAEIATRSETVFSYAGRPIRYVVTVDVLAFLDGNGQADLTAKENALRDALARPYQDFVFKQDNGAPSGIYLRNSASASGVRVVSGPNFENQASDGEYVIQRAARFQVAAEFVIRNAENAVVSFQETLSVQGTGGPDRRWRFPVNTVPIRQVVSPYSLVVTIQRGTAVGHTTRPTPPNPLWPEFLVHPRRGKAEDSPKPLGRINVDWPVHWEYVFESYVPLVGIPNLPPV